MATERARVFVSFDFDHDKDLKELLVGQAKNPKSPFEIADWSVKAPEKQSEWKDKVRTRIKQVDVGAVICGEKTDTASGVNIEVRMAHEEKASYFLLEGRKSTSCKKPKAAKSSDKIYTWSWDNLEKLIAGAR